MEVGLINLIKTEHMKSIFTLLCLVAIGLTGSAQTSFSWSPNDSIVTNLSPNTYTELKIKQIKQQPGSLDLAIEVVYNDIPATWDGMVCVFGSCLGTIPAVGGTADQSTISTANDTGYVRLTVNPFNGTETATLRIRVYDKNNPSDGDTATWVVQGQGLGIHDYEATNTLTMYPNPAINTLNIESDASIDKVQLVSINGQVVFTKDLNNIMMTTLDISDVKNGVYMINTFSEGRLVGVDKLMINGK